MEPACRKAEHARNEGAADEAVAAPQPNAQPERDAERGVSVGIAVAKAARDVAVRPAGPSVPWATLGR